MKTRLQPGPLAPSDDSKRRCRRAHRRLLRRAPASLPSLQIEEETRNLAHYTDFRVVSVVGGQSIEDQGFLLR